MFLLAGPVVLLAAFAACVALARAARRRPLGLAAVLGAALLVFLETILLDLLSIFHAVARPGLLLGNAAIVALCLAARRWRWRTRPAWRWPAWVSHPSLLPIAALGSLAAISALAYLPNNWDSMTYHLARVAHWYQHRSVFPYPTHVSRQIALSPGAEHLLLVLQVVAASDGLASLVQLGAWVVVAAAAPALARSFGAPRRAATWGALLFAAAPMALLQASSTQNDLAAAAMAMATVVACLPFLHRRRRWRTADLALLLATVTAGLLVKPTSAVVTAPFLLWGLLRTAPQLRRAATWRGLAPVLPILALALGALGPFVAARRATPEIAETLRPFVYAGAQDLGDRTINWLRGLARNVPAPASLVDRLAPPRTVGCDRPDSLCTQRNLCAFHEDTTGNPGLALLFLLALPVALLRLVRLPGRVPITLACLASSWLLFHALFRDNVWITRLQLPLFALAPLALGAFPGSWFQRGARGALTWLLLAALVAHGAVAAVLNASRPLVPSQLFGAQAATGYYGLARPGVMEAHAAALDALERTSCSRLGLFIGGDSYDYPLTWRAIQRGAEVRHLMGPDAWPCVVFSDLGPPPPRPGTPWRETAPGVYVAP